MNQKTCAQSKKKLIRLCEIMDNHIKNGDFFELYSCWVGEKADNRESEITLQINNFVLTKLIYLKKR